jgi:hypothetical protein
VTLDEIQRIKPALIALEGGLRDDVRDAIRRLTYARITGKPVDECIDIYELPRVGYDFSRIETIREGDDLSSDILVVPPGRHEIPLSVLPRENSRFIGLPDADSHAPTLILRDDKPDDTDEEEPPVRCLCLDYFRSARFAHLKLDAEKPVALRLHLQDQGEENEERFEHYLHEVECAPNVEFCDANQNFEPLYARRDWALALQKEGLTWTFLWMKAPWRNVDCALQMPK